ncbi:MAG: hypothetical protein F6K48_25750 [Okeania sp. SIO3H1]|uniref:hypothetical protein n=1 Tax=Okeania sp. SIO1I7 TaxID=2607772 RepID=UPI0013C79AC0|nr:hypothetical protein [Okeania sp. SIO1I7]NEN92121.1 hypothetical protein [Okeania sp. SIO3H1]NET24031.1 hypothetical protein [Okeania sp. SIO1I7]
MILDISRFDFWRGLLLGFVPQPNLLDSVNYLTFEESDRSRKAKENIWKFIFGEVS